MPVSTHGLGRGVTVPLASRVELHEHEIPDFDVSPAIAGKFAVGVALVGRYRPIS